jgi:hypothetical protein
MSEVPPRKISPGLTVAAKVMAAKRSVLAVITLASLMCMKYPGRIASGGNPETAEPGVSPRSPPMMVRGPVLATVLPAITAYLAANFRGIGVALQRMTLMNTINVIHRITCTQAWNFSIYIF